uniref:Uncharacterized protein n=1 Tax=Panstrongylus lignarius TaxID=156445 RepID=A0A224Y5L7_9HEMI
MADTIHKYIILLQQLTFTHFSMGTLTCECSPKWGCESESQMFSKKEVDSVAIFFRSPLDCNNSPLEPLITNS